VAGEFRFQLERGHGGADLPYLDRFGLEGAGLIDQRG
jgi:hypothetical protein